MGSEAHTGAADARSTTRRLAAIVAAYRRRRFAALFVTLLLTLAFGGTLQALVPGLKPMQVLLGVNLLAAIGSFAHEGDMRIPLALGATYLVTRLLLALLGMPALLAVSDGAWVVTIVLATVVAARHAFGRGVVDRERIFAALDAYLLVGLLFGVAYAILDHVWPGSFGNVAAGNFDLPRAMYFSFVTLATLGYGDIVPAIPAARGLAIVEGVSGQMYLTVVVARLVSLYSRDQDR